MAAWEAGLRDQMVHNAAKPGYGYNAWNAFFIRQFVPGARPFHGDPKININIGCETTPWQYVDNVKLEADFCIRDVNYSLLDHFGGQRQWAMLFEGGQVYKGFLSRPTTTAGAHRSTAPWCAHGCSRERSSHSARGKARTRGPGRAPNRSHTSARRLPGPSSFSSMSCAATSRSCESGWWRCRPV